jgi:phosphoglycolate phosphatase-like HAD superfamily hydrolase
MDGLLIDSEDKYTEITNAILQEFGKPLLPWEIKAQLQGRPQPEVLPRISFQSAQSARQARSLLCSVLIFYNTGKQDLPPLGPTPHQPRRIRREASRPASQVLPAIAAPTGRQNPPFQPSLDPENRTSLHRPGDIIA